MSKLCKCNKEEIRGRKSKYGKRIVSVFLVIIMCLSSSWVVSATEAQEENDEQKLIQETEESEVIEEGETEAAEEESAEIPEEVEIPEEEAPQDENEQFGEVVEDTQENAALEDIEVVTDINVVPVEVNEEFDSSEVLDNLGEVSYSQGILIDDTEYALYPEFEDVGNSLEVIKEKAGNAFTFLKDNYSLEDISNEN